MTIVRVIREACCSADDQIGPLQADYQLNDNASFAELIDQINRSGFLQFSSTHNQLSGELNGICVVEVFASSFKWPKFYIDRQQSVDRVIAGQTLYFNFRHVKA